MLVNDLLHEILIKTANPERFVEQCKIKNIEVNFASYNPITQTNGKIEFKRPFSLPEGVTLQITFNYNNKVISNKGLTEENNKLLDSLFG